MAPSRQVNNSDRSTPYDYIGEVDAENSLQRQRAPQASRFMCLVECENNTKALICQLKNNKEVKYLQWSQTQVYVEIPKKKACSSLEAAYPAIIKATISSNHIQEINVLGTFGTMMGPSKKEPRGLGQQKESHQHFQEFYNVIRKSGKVPLMEENNIDYILERERYDIIANEAMKNYHRHSDEGHLKLSAWQKKAMRLIETQAQVKGDNRRKILWIFDCKGNMGKSEFCDWLVKKKGFQDLPAGTAHHVAGQIDPTAEGYIFNLEKNAFTKRNAGNTSDLFSLAENVKDGKVKSAKFKGVRKDIQNPIVVVFSNAMPNISTLSVDRWMIFHTSLGLINVSCVQDGRNYDCIVDRKTKTSDDKGLPNCLVPIYKKEEKIIEEYLDNVVRLDLSSIVKNDIAFPNCCTFAHKVDLRGMLRSIADGNRENCGVLLTYCREKKCLQGSITNIRGLESILESYNYLAFDEKDFDFDEEKEETEDSGNE